jgi:LytS/YehU family sensor histidine kinase
MKLFGEEPAWAPNCDRDARWRRVAEILLADTVIGLGILAVFLLSNLHEMLARFWFYLWLYQLYSHSTGTLAALLMPPLAARLSGRPQWLMWPLYILALVGVGLAGPAIGTWIPFAAGAFGSDGFWPIYASVARITLIVTLTIGIGSYVVEKLRSRVQAAALQLRTQQLERERALKLAAEARFDSLQSRLQPHFLFNTINSILALMPEDARRAEQMLERLARLLRFALDAQQAPLVPLSAELRLLDDYLEIEQVRFGPRLRYTIGAPAEIHSYEVPAYALQTLVENSMKHAVAPRREGGTIKVSVYRANGSLVAEVCDDGPGFTREALLEGHGLDMLEQRLHALYGDRAALEIVSGPGACVRLSLPLGVTV